jgi:hypothetical protein
MTKHSTLVNVAVFIVGVFVPIVGHILDTILILRDGHRWPGKALWLLVVWLFPFVGPLLYMLFGQTSKKEVIKYDQRFPNYKTTGASIKF